MNVAVFGHLHNLFITDVSGHISISDVVSNAGIKQHWLLLHIANLRTQPLEIKSCYILSIQSDNPNRW